MGTLFLSVVMSIAAASCCGHPRRDKIKKKIGMHVGGQLHVSLSHKIHEDIDDDDDGYWTLVLCTAANQ